MPVEQKVRKLGFYRMMRRNFDEGRRIRVLDHIAFKFIIGTRKYV